MREQLQPDEEISYKARPTQLTLLPPLLLILIIIASSIIVYYQTGAFAIILIGAAVATIGLVYLLGKLFLLKSNEYVVTNRRIVKQTGILNKRSVDTYLDKINNVEHHQTLWGRILGYGDLEIDTASETGTTRFPMVAKPLEFKQAILAEAQRYRAGHAVAAAPAPSGAARLRDLKALLDDGLITQAEYDEKRRELVESL